MATSPLDILARLHAAIGSRPEENPLNPDPHAFAEQRQWRKNIRQYLREAPLAFVLMSPVIYSVIIPLMLLDIWLTLYQHICFRVYRIPRVTRGDYIFSDRHRLAYLNWIEALNCLYCSYANGVIAYAREIAGRTEQYWCPIKHAQRLLDPHHRYAKFLNYGDAEGYRTQLMSYRHALQDARPIPPRRFI